MLDLRVETFLAVCRTMNYTKAAEELHITQPAVSQHIHGLESQYRTKLFRYENRRLSLTESGQLLRRTAETMVHDARRMEEAIHAADNRRSLHFGATLTIGEYCMAEPLHRLLREEPDTQIQMLTANTYELLTLLDRGEIDFAVVEGNFDQSAYDSLVYSTQRFIPVAAANYPFPQPVRILAHLLGERLLVREPGSGTRNVLERALESRNLSVDSFAKVTELGSLNLIKQLAEQGAGIAFFYEPVVRQELESGTLVEIPLSDCAITHDFSFLWKRGSAFSQEYRRYFSMLQETAESP
ncbi:MAG: LysR family transcriptional regulator [Acutalibacter sp.]|jgi:DNA-binding transcriptional LysR family regulator